MYERNYTFACSVFILCNEFRPNSAKFPLLRTRSIRPDLEVSALKWSLLMDKIGKEM